MRQLFEDAITIEKIGNYGSEELCFDIEKAVLSGDKPTLNIHVKLNFVIPYDEHLKIKAIIKNKIPGISDVKLNYKYVVFIKTIVTFNKYENLLRFLVL